MGIERGSLSSKDNLFPCDPSQTFSPSSHPSASPVPSVIAPIVLDGVFPISRCPFRVRLIRNVSWRFSRLAAPCGFRLYLLSGCRLALNVYLLCLRFGAVSCGRRASGILIRVQCAPPITRKSAHGLKKPVLLLLSCVLFFLFY